jgi:CheY-like chemotaxis protein/HPt (histidine-containing phosphotransfer) domain-containing protein
VKVDDTEPLRVAFSITDNGIGMTETTLDGLFVSFSQAETSTTRRFGGTGLGLAISKRLVDIMHGQIAVRSIPDAGSTFTVTLPFEIDNETPLRPRPDLSGLDGIIVSSHGHYDSDLCSYLEYAGMRVQLAHDLNSAIQQASDKPAPIVIHAAEMDITSIAIDTLHMAFSAVPDARHVVIIRGSVRRARVEAAHVVTMDGAPLRQRVLLRAVAVAAGRASPEIFYLDNGNDAGNSQIKAPSIAEARVQGRLILVAEDDVINQKVILKQLSLLGYAAEIAKDGVEALEMWHQGDYALLLTDLHMPNMDGYTLVQAIRRAQKHGQQRPVIALTANALKGEVLHAMSQGMDEYLTKPIQLDRLGAALEKWMPQMHAEPGQIRTPEASHADRESALVDVSILKGLVGDDEETVCNFLSDYLGSGLAYASELRAAFTAEDIRRIGDISHKFKSSSRSVGALTLGDLCAELENAAKADDRVVLAKMMQEVEATLNAVVNEIDLILAKPKHGVPL